MTAKQLKDIHNFKQEGDKSLYHAWERYNDLLYKCPTHDINSHQKVNIFYKGLSTMNRQLLDSHGPIPGMRPAEALTAIQTMADHSQKWHDGTTSRNIRSSGSKDGLATLVNKLDNLGRDMKKLKERPPGYYTKIDNRSPYAERRQSLEELLAKHQEKSAQISTEMEEKSKQAKVVTVENEGPSSPKKLKNLHRISFLSDSQEENTIDQLPTKESNPKTFHASLHYRLRIVFGAKDPDEDPFGRCLDEYNWVFPKEIEQLTDEYKIKIGKKGKFLKKYGQNVKELEVRIKIGGMITGMRMKKKRN
ncbi:hypothetical protein Tco_0935668 [Tanacetum coccineum]